MEIKLENVYYRYKNKKIFNDLNISFDSSSIIGVIGDDKSTFLSILDLIKKYDGNIYVDNVLVDRSNIVDFQRKIGYVRQDNSFFSDTVKGEFYSISKFYNINNNTYVKRAKDSLNMVGLDKNVYNRKIDTLSESEIFLLKIACVLFLNSKVILIDDCFNYLDDYSCKYIINLLKKLNSSKDRIILLSSNNIDFIYKYTKKLIVLHDGEIVRYDKTKDILCDLEFLKSYGVEVPLLVQFTKMAKDKGVKISYHQDILDLIKDVYKHV